MSALSNELEARIRWLESSIKEKDVKAEFNMVIGELMLSVKTLEFELRSERKKVEAMRHNLRALSQANPSYSQISPRNQSNQMIQTRLNAHPQGLSMSHSETPRYLSDSSSTLQIKHQYKNFREAQSKQSIVKINHNNSLNSPNQPNQRPNLAETRGRSMTSIPQASPTKNRPLPTPPSSSILHTARSSVKTTANTPFSDLELSQKPLKTIKDPIDDFSIDDVVVDSPFIEPPYSTGNSSNTPTKPIADQQKMNSIPEQSETVVAKTTSYSPSSEASDYSPIAISTHDHSQHHREDPPSDGEINSDATSNSSLGSLKVSINSNVSADSSKIESKRTTPTTSPAKFEIQSLPLERIHSNIPSLSSPHHADVDITIRGLVPLEWPQPEDEPFTVDQLFLELQAASKEGTKQRIALENSRKSLVVQNMSSPQSNPDASHSSKSVKFRKHKSKLEISSPSGIRVGSYRAEQVELERIFQLCKDYVDPPSATRRAEEAKFNDKLRTKMGILKESLDYDVNLSDCDLYAIAPFVLDTFCKTTRFDLSCNKLTEIPKEIKRFDQLEDFDLSNNLIVRIPGAISHLKSLQQLKLQHNKITEIPLELSYLISLEYLDLSENQIREIPKTISHLKALRYLFIGNNPISTLPAEIGHLSQLQVLSVQGGMLKKLPKELCALVELEVLDLSSNSLKELPSNIGLLTKLQELRVDHNMLTDLPHSLGLCSLLFNGGTFEASDNPWNPKAIPNDASIAQLLQERLNTHSKHLSKLQAPQLPKLPTIPPFKSHYADEGNFTLQEKILCCGDWATHTIDAYLRPALSKLSRAIKAIKSLEEYNIKIIVDIIKQVRVVVMRAEEFLPAQQVASLLQPPTFDETLSELEQMKSIMTSELFHLDAITRTVLPIIRSCAITEKLEDTVTVVNLVHLVRELLYVLVLENQEDFMKEDLEGENTIQERSEAIESPRDVGQ